MNTDFYYKPLPSAALIGDYPTHLVLQACTSSRKGINALGWVSGVLVTPISLAFTPIAIVADIIIGFSEAIFMACKGADKHDIRELLFKKVVVSPIQQTVSASVRFGVFTIFPFIWLISYAISRGVVECLPSHLNHTRMEIFILQTVPDTPLKVRIEEAIANGSRGSSYQTSPSYATFKKKIFNRESPKIIFGFGNKSFTQSELDKRYRKLAQVIHPDRNPNTQEEAHLLFGCLNEAYQELKNR